MIWGPLIAGAVSGILGGLNKSSNSGSPVNYTNTGQANEGQQSWMPNDAAMGGYGFLAQNFPYLMQNPVPYFPGQGYVGPSELTQQGIATGQQGIEAGKNAVNAMTPFLGQMGQNYSFLSNAADVANNPYVQGMNDMTTQNLNQNLMENLLPQVNSGAMSVNALGSGRNGLLEGQAIGDTQNAIADAQTQTNMGAYNSGLGAQQFALGQTGNVLNNLMMPSQALAALGQGQQGMGSVVEGYQQKALDDAKNRFNYQYQEPYTRMGNLQNILSFLQPLGTSYSAGTGANGMAATNPGYISPMQGAMGGALQGINMGLLNSGLYGNNTGGGGFNWAW